MGGRRGRGCLKLGGEVKLGLEGDGMSENRGGDKRRWDREGYEWLEIW